MIQNERTHDDIPNRLPITLTILSWFSILTFALSTLKPLVVLSRKHNDERTNGNFGEKSSLTAGCIMKITMIIRMF